jgi:hypothetical protein
MSKKTDQLSTELDNSYAEQSYIYQTIMQMTADPAPVAALLRQLEANTMRRVNTQRQLDNSIERDNTDWFQRVFHQ